MKKKNAATRTISCGIKCLPQMLCLIIPIIALFAIPALPLTTTTTTTNPIKTVVVVGGTHGNEYTGVWCIQEIQARPDHWQSRYPSLQISTLLGNPQAYRQNKRFIHSDLNREFSREKLMDDRRGPTVESTRARELNDLLGPKQSPKTDLVVDLHSTTTNMGVTVIIPEGDLVMAQAAAYVLHQLPQVKIVMHAIPNRMERPNLGSTAKHGFTIEVGPVPQGVLRHDIVEQTQAVLHHLLDFLESYGEKLSTLQRVYRTGMVPCFRSAHAKRPGEMSGKIPWPSSKDNPNFPAYMIHKSVQDRDYHLIRKGDPLFVTLEGTVLEYNGSHGDEVYLIFVNEGGYYYESSGTGIGVAVKSEYDITTATFMECDREPDSHECALE